MAMHSVKYLSRLHWKSIVIGVKNPGRGGIDDSALPDIPRDTIVYRTHTFENPLTQGLSRLQFLPDSKIGWYSYGLREARKAIQKHSPDIIVSRSTPITSHLIALQLKRETKLPWIACFSDPWVSNPYAMYHLPFLKHFQEQKEKVIFAEADKIVVTNEQTRRLFSSIYPIDGKIEVIYNSYDSETMSRNIDFKRKEKFVLTHTGNFYGIRSPEPLFRALEKLIDRQEIRTSIRVQLFGSLGPFKKLISRYGLSSIVDVKGTVPRKEALWRLMASDVLLVIDAPSKGESLFLPSKLVDYIALGKPILAITPGGASADVIEKTKTGMIASPEDTKSIQEALLAYFNKWRAGHLLLNPNWEEIQKYSASVLMERFAKIMEDTIEKYYHEKYVR
ncbi:MAG: glycosyltransferase [Candidatus Wildermuthbacteria bacterium]|nr:glycosyltransferase [Candidatus Wildermuthbacteria bacterium]